MRILVTGGTGFVGAHSVKALLDAGHEVKLMVRDPARIAPALEPLGITDPLEYAVADVTDGAAVAAALEDCDAVLHAASVYTMDSRRNREIRDTNLAGAQAVLGKAVELGLDPIVHVSSVVALIPPATPVLNEESEPGAKGPPYAASKQAQERYARELQAQGAPVVITYPGSVWGPHDPYDGESTRLARDFVRGQIPFRPRAGLPFVDVRDVAAAHARLFEPGKGPRRYILGGTYLTIPELAMLVDKVSEKRHRGMAIPTALAHSAGLFMSATQRITPFRLPLDSTSTWVLRQNARADNSRAQSELGVTLRPFEETVRDQLAWQREARRL